MAFSKKEGIKIYRKLLTNFYRGDYVSKASRDVNICKEGVALFLNKMAKQGYIFLTCGDKGRTYVNFTKKGKVLLKDFDVGKSL